MSFEDGRDLVTVGVRVPGRGSELFEELVPAARHEDDDEFGWLIGEVQKRVRETAGQIGKATGVESVLLIADPDLESTAEDVNRLASPVGTPGPPPHYHEDCAEFFYVTAGRLGVMNDGHRTSLGPGEYIEVPRGVIHTFRNDGDQEARMITGYDISGSEDWFEEFGFDTTIPGAYESSISEQTIRRVAEESHRYHMILAPEETHARSTRAPAPNA